MKRFLTVLLALVLTLCACGKGKNDGLFRAFDERSKTEHANGYSDAQVMLTVDGQPITYSELRYYFLAERALTDIDAMSDEQRQAWMTETVIADIVEPRAIAALAAEHGVALDEDEQKSARNYIAEVKERAGSSFASELAQASMTEDLYDFVLMQGQLSTKLLQFYQDEMTTPVHADDATVLNAEQTGDLVHVKHILIRCDQSDSPAQALTLAEQLHGQIVSGADFDALMQEYSQDPGLEDAQEGYYIFRYEMNEDFEQAAFTLEVGQVSAVIAVTTDTYSGYHIIKRESVDPEYMSAHLDTLRTNYMASCFYRDVQAYAQRLTVTYTDAWQALDINRID